MLTLTDGQQEAYKEIKEFFEDPRTGGYHVLEGNAGTGKTFVTCQILKDTKKDILVTAPTNKALKVLKADCGGIHNVEFKTLHSAFGLKPKIDNDGNIQFVTDAYNKKPLGYVYDIIIIDEMSMVSDNLFNIIKNEVDLRQMKILFIGDRCQIPPVNQEYSLPCNEDVRQSLGFHVHKLTEIVRQSKGNPIIESSVVIRSNLLSDNKIPIIGDITKINSNREVDMVLRELFLSDEFKASPDHAKVLAWHNSTVDVFNKTIRKMIYGKDANDRIVVGEELIANSPILSGDEVLFTTNAEFQVISIVKMKDIAADVEFKYYKCRVKDEDTGDEKDIRVLDNESLELFQRLLDELKKHAMRLKYGSPQAKQAWGRYYQTMSLYADIGYNYAITVHKSQGSSYTNAVVCEYDIDRNPNTLERNRIKYTAMTRPRKKLYVI